MLKRVGLGHLYHHRSLGGYLNSRFRRPRAFVSPYRWTASVVTPRPTTTQNSCLTSSERAFNSPLPPDVINRVEEIFSNNGNDQSVILHLQKCPELLRYLLNYEHACEIAEGLACTRRPSLSLRFLHVAHTLGCRFRDNPYECVSFHLAEKRNWNDVLSAVSLAQQHRGRLSLRLLNWRTRAYVETENYKALQHILAEFKEHHLEPTRRTFHLILSGHIRNRDLYKAKECLKTMTEANCPPDATTHAIVATHYRRLGMDLDVEARALQGLEDVTPTTAVAVLNSLITLRLDTRDVAGALQLSTLFNRKLMDPIIATMTPRQDLSSAQSTKPKPQHIPVISVPLTPNAATYSLFINYQASRSNLRGALQIFRAMLMAETQITPNALASIIHALYMGGKGDIAVRMVASLCSCGKTPSPLFNRLLSSTTSDDFPWVPSGIPPTVRIFNSLIKGVLSTHGLKGMEIVLQIMHDYDVKPTAATLEILMNHVKRAEGGHARVLSRLLRRLSSSDILPTLRHIHIICSSVLHSEKNLVHGFGWDNIAAKFSNTRKAHVRPYPEHRISGDATSFDPTAGIEFPKALRQRSLVRPAIESLQSRDILCDAPMLALRIRHDSVIRSDMDAAKEVFEVMLERGIHPDEYHFSALMEGFARAGDLEGAFDVMHSASRAGVKPNVVMFTILIVGYAHKGNPDKAIQVFEDMISSGIAPDVPSIDAVASAFFIIGAYKMAKTVLRTLWTYIQPFPANFERMPLKNLAQAFRSLHTKQRPGDFELPKADRLALHLELNRLRALWNMGKMHRRFRRTSQDFNGKISNHDPPNE
ncbi:Pentatricopeptide repeat-containing protein, mitochondrial [Termitomyces sp. J132]|nr:hypothetical protein H2248_000739 [Termitomyces sp. 'cryptogamus']KNZ73412.1 Pentatricopeptide repeat-containing protein, mitochondrial [Termitomyces sp. J132]